MPPTLQLAPDLELPLDFVTRRTAIVGQTDTGKTSTAVVVVEEAKRAGAQVVVIDPSGAWWGVTSNAAGDGPGLDMVVLGGEHGDAPLNEHAGRAVARLVAEHGYSVVLDLDRPYFKSWASRQRFVADFLSELYEVCRSQILVVIDECHRFAPQAVRDEGGDAARCLGAVVDVVALGRRRGLAVIAITQRLAKLHKDVLELCEIMVAHRLRGNNDRKALQGWLEAVGESIKEVMTQVSGLEKGVARVSAPTLQIEGVFRIRMKDTFDSSRTIDVGESLVEPETRSSFDREALRELMADTIEKAEATDPRALQKRVDELEEKLAAGGTEDPHLRMRMEDAERELVEARDALEPLAAGAMTDGSIVPIARVVVNRFHALRNAITQAAPGLRTVGHDLLKGAEHFEGVLGSLLEVGDGLTSDAGAEPEEPRRASTSKSSADGAESTSGRASGSDADHRNGDGPPLKAGHVRILTALLRYRERGLNRAELVPLASFQSKRTVGDYVAHLKGVGYVGESADGGLWLTDAGLRATPDEPAAAPLTRDEVYARQGGKLKAGHRRMLEALFKVHPDGYTRPELAGVVGMNKRTAGDYVAHLKKHGLVDERGRRIYAGYVFYLAEAERAAA